MKGARRVRHLEGGHGEELVEAAHGIEAALAQADAAEPPQLREASRQLQRAAGVQSQLLQGRQPHELLYNPQLAS